MFSADQLTSLLRTVLKIGGAYLVTKGVATDADMGTALTSADTLIGSGAVLLGLVMSWFKHKA